MLTNLIQKYRDTLEKCNSLLINYKELESQLENERLSYEEKFEKNQYKTYEELKNLCNSYDSFKEQSMNNRNNFTHLFSIRNKIYFNLILLNNKDVLSQNAIWKIEIAEMERDITKFQNEVERLKK